MAMHAWSPSHLRLVLCSAEKTESYCKLYIFSSDKQTFDHLEKFMCLPFELIFTMQFNVYEHVTKTIHWKTVGLRQPENVLTVGCSYSIPTVNAIKR